MATEAPERKKIYRKRRKLGLCPRCGGKVKNPGKFSYCDDCRGYFRSYQQENTDTVQEARRSRYEDRKMKGLCPRCGEFVGRKSKTTLCQKCLEKQYMYNTGEKRPKRLSKKN